MDPNPIKHVGSLLKRVRVEIEPVLLECGFVVESDTIPSQQAFTQFRYFRKENQLLSISYSFHTGCLTAEYLGAGDLVQVVANVPLGAPRSTEDIMQKCEAFSSEIISNMRNILA